MSALTKPSLTLKRRIDAPVERVWQAWTSGETLKRWFGPSDTLEVTVADVDLRIGGHYRIVVRGSDGEKHEVGGIYRAIEPHARLVFTWAWASTPERESLVTVALAADGNATILTLTHEQFADEPARDRHEKGWTGCLEKLARHLSQYA